MRLEEWLREWLYVCVKNNVKLKTFNRYKDIIELHVIPCIGELDLNEVNYSVLSKFIAKRKESGNLKTGGGLSSSSVNGIIVLLKNSLNEAVEFGIIENNPCRNLKKMRDESKKVDALTINEQRKLEDYVLSNGKKELIGIMVCLYTGVRIGELLNLKWTDIDFKKKIIFVSRSVVCTKNYDNKYVTIVQLPKTPSSKRMIPVPVELLKKLIDLKRACLGEYIVSRNRQPISIRSYQYIFASTLQKLKLRKMGFHSLRHTFATRALECGFDVKTLSEIMGHSSVSITINLYAHSHFDQKILMMDKLNKIYPKRESLEYKMDLIK